MKGAILAGGGGSRLLPLTEKINKHLLPVYNKPMIFYPIELLKSLGINEIMVVTNRENAGLTEEILGDGSRFGMEATYRVQEYTKGKQTGIAKALELAKSFAGGEAIIVILGDNIFGLSEADANSVKSAMKEVSSGKSGATIFLKEVDNPSRFGVPVFDKDGKIVLVEEKPENPKSKYAVTGLYIYDGTVFDKISRLKPSARGEFEITEVSNLYLKEGTLRYKILKGDWTDAGTFESLYEASTIARKNALERAGKKSP